MYINDIPTKTKSGKLSHLCTLLRESYREGGKVKTRTLLNLTHRPSEEVAALRLALKHKGDLSKLVSVQADLELQQGASVGGIWLLYEISQRLGVEPALGKTRAGKLALWQVLARILDQGSRLSAVRLAQETAVGSILGLGEGFNEEHLYRNLSWLAENQAKIEKCLYRKRTQEQTPDLFLYDVTSSYFEGQSNELADWGYSRDKKRGKKQVVIGLLCDQAGYPISVEVFRGNTRDFNTFGQQVQKVAQNFGCQRVTWVGDRGMIKSAQIEDLKQAGFHYITALTKPEIESLLQKGVLQRALFEERICEVSHEGLRYILRRNPLRAQEMAKIRQDKKESVNKLLQKKNLYLAQHRRAKVNTALQEINRKIESLKISDWLKVEIQERTLKLIEDSQVLAKKSALDGCYVIKSDLPPEINKQIIHDRYKSLSEVEQAFRICKTGLLHLRPWFVQTEASTRGHALVVMLAYLISHYLQQIWAPLNLTVAEGLRQLSKICTIKVACKGRACCQKIPTPTKEAAKLLQAANVRLPKMLPLSEINVSSRKKLQSRRKMHQNQ
jgi:hypothetical protein